ncbi:hypothetical protein SDC9_196615 [bioreactor metagenome]|uniref:Uncharacterized protein n=1 Tax=bioreactor metagenome TaxID=1076179 RepID=A0A645IDT5_9ZZZZ
MRNEERDSLAVQREQGFSNCGVGFGVDGAHRIVKDQNRRLLHQRPRDGDALLLSAGERDPALAYERFVALIKRLNHLVDTRRARGAVDVLLAGAGRADANVLHNRA